MTIELQCPSCSGTGRCATCKGMKTLRYTGLDVREAEVARHEAAIARREEALQLREADHRNAIKLIQSCLHPDKQLDPKDKERFTKAFQAFLQMVDAAREEEDEEDTGKWETPF